MLLCRHLLSRLLKLSTPFLQRSPPRHSVHAAALSPQTHTHLPHMSARGARSAHTRRLDERRMVKLPQVLQSLTQAYCQPRSTARLLTCTKFDVFLLLYQHTHASSDASLPPLAGASDYICILSQHKQSFGKSSFSPFHLEPLR